MAILFIIEFFGAAALAYAFWKLACLKRDRIEKRKVKAFWRKGIGMTYLSLKGRDIWLNGMILADTGELPAPGETVWLHEIGGSLAMKGIVQSKYDSPLQIHLIRK